MVEPAGCHGDGTVAAVARKALAECPGTWPTRWASSATVKPGGMVTGKTFGPLPRIPVTVAKLELRRKA